MVPPEVLKSIRDQLLRDGRGLTTTYPDATVNVQPGTRIYVLAFNGDKAGPRLTRSGIYQGVGVKGLKKKWAGDRSTDAILVTVQWDGDDDQSTHPDTTIGLNARLSDGGPLLAVTSLEDITPCPVEDRPHKQRTAHPVDLGTEDSCE